MFPLCTKCSEILEEPTSDRCQACGYSDNYEQNGEGLLVGFIFLEFNIFIVILDSSFSLLVPLKYFLARELKPIIKEWFSTKSDLVAAIRSFYVLCEKKRDLINGMLLAPPVSTHF
jgi:hypothetical protein